MKKLNTFFPALLNRASRDPEVVLIFLREMWPHLAGAKMADHCRPEGLEGKTLIVSVAERSWKEELCQAELQRRLLASINDFWQKRLIERIRVEMRPM
ncbi:MAG TPA: DUF721 domain-containing protein [Acidobacteriota bacterium]|nr:DUF721 domain-containing protein [Acidobacteriota bacterium]